MFDLVTQERVDDHMEFKDLVVDRRLKLGLSQPQLADKVGHGMKQQDVQRIESGKTKNSKYFPHLRKALNITDKEFGHFYDRLHEEAQKQRETAQVFSGSMTTAPVKGETAAGVWLENEYLDEAKYEAVPHLPIRRFTRLRQFAYKVAGRSMEEERIFDGDYVICVDYLEARGTPLGGDIVVAERNRGGLTERSCKLLNGSAEEGFSLLSRSRELVFRDPIPLGEDDETFVQVIGLVVGVYRPM